MIVFQNVFGSVDYPFEPFIRALGKDNVGWIDRNITLDDLKPGIAKRFKVIGGPLPLDTVLALPGVRFVAMILDDPATRTMRQWYPAAAFEDHPYHACAQAFSPREVLEENLPFARALRDATTRLIAPKDAEPSVEAALARIEAGPFMIGDPGDLAPFVQRMARVLDVTVEDFGPDPFSAKPLNFPRRTGMPKVQASNPMDSALFEALYAMQPENRKLIVTKRDKANRPKARHAAD